MKRAGYGRACRGLVSAKLNVGSLDELVAYSKAHEGAVKRAGKLVDFDLASVRRQAAASRDYLVDRLGWPRSVIDTSLSGR
jgi:hypothetical protein